MNEEAASGAFYLAHARPVVRAYYDLTRQPASWDFWTWITLMRARGATRVVFDPAVGFKYRDRPVAEQQQMFDEVVLPICELFGLEHCLDRERPGDLRGQHIYRHGITQVRHEELMQFALEPAGPPTVTLRQSRKHPERDSDPAVWLPFAEAIGARVIEDAWVTPLSVRERFEIYRRSPMNYFANNGPGGAAMWSNLPALMVNPPGACVEWVPRGEQYPFATEHQRMYWGPVTVAGLLEEEMRSKLTRAGWVGKG